MDPRLAILHHDIAVRCGSISAQHSAWPCRSGCDHCCRNLANPPQLTPPEWEVLRPAVLALPEPVRAAILKRAASGDARVCPLLDSAAGTCLVYDARPVACRTYGFYVERDLGLYCGQVVDLVESGACADVIFGNAAAVDERLSVLGPAR